MSEEQKTYTIEMSVDEWQEVPSNPIQRNTEAHAAAAVKQHLAKPHISHKFVSMAVLPNGDRFALDGHTRRLLWKTGRLDPVDFNVTVTVFECADEEAVRELYLTFDNALAAESVKDKMYGALRAHGYAPTSKLVREGGIATAIYFWSRDRRPKRSEVMMHKMVKPWVEAIKQLDAVNARVDGFSSGVVCAALITLARDGDEARTFWSRYKLDQGIRTEEGRDGVEALCHWMGRRKSLMVKPTQGEICARALTCYEYFKNGLFLKKIPTEAALLSYQKYAKDFIEKHGGTYEGDLGNLVAMERHREYRRKWQRKNNGVSEEENGELFHDERSEEDYEAIKDALENNSTKVEEA